MTEEQIKLINIIKEAILDMLTLLEKIKNNN